MHAAYYLRIGKDFATTQAHSKQVVRLKPAWSFSIALTPLPSVSMPKTQTQHKGRSVARRLFPKPSSDRHSPTLRAARLMDDEPEAEQDKHAACA
eukprot:6200577-Pleurochrysis_carterae.AAC.3